jgi:hypothetical protein
LAELPHERIHPKMFKLIINCKFDPFAKMDDREEELKGEFDTSSQAELRGLRWLMYRPNDIVMLVEIKQSVCIHCGVAVFKRPDGVLHVWAHEGGYFACISNGGKTKATPKEVE